MIRRQHRGQDSDISQDNLSDELRSKLASRTYKISMAVTVLIGVVELIFWIFSRNNLFLIEGTGNLIWLCPDLVMLYTIRMGCRKADWKMNFGYRRIETISLLFFSLGIIGFVLYIIFRTVTGVPEQFPTEYGLMTIALSAGIIIVLGFLGDYIWNTGKKIKSRLLMLDSMVVRMDMASAAILLFSGIFLVIAPSVIVIQTILTILVGLVLFVYSVKEAVQAIKELIDASPSLQVMNLIEEIAEETPGVTFISELRTRSYGGAISVSITLEAAPDMTIREAYEIRAGLEDRIRSQLENVIEVQARVNPTGTYVAEQMSEDD
ncbi:MAG TPA: cation diffusion facilitator family transporter [Methanoregula sp.]|nr:cation diffusion facilitator family transporter [Methanoregula sp.]